MVLDHETAAELLFIAVTAVPASVSEAMRVAAEEYTRIHGDLTVVATQMASQFGDHPESATARMRRCLAVAPLHMVAPEPSDTQEFADLGTFERLTGDW